jgi:methionyl-tRNA formyltransferase
VTTDGKRTSTGRLRVHIITEDDPLYVIRFFDVFFAEYPRDEFDVLGITIARPFRESRLATAKRMLRFYGSWDFLRLAARFSLTKVRGRSIARLARREGIQLVPSPSVNDPAYVAGIEAADTDVILSVAAPEIFGPELLRAPHLGAVNVHSGRLPQYRGMMPTFWQMLHGEGAVTVTVHEMAPKIDAGRILATEECSVREHDSLGRVMEEAKVVGARLVIRTLRDLAAGTASPRSIDVATGAYRSFPKSSDARAFRARGHILL